jgi:hypothetical protein
MVDVIHKRCEFDACPVQPSFNFSGEKNGKYCKVHAVDGMVDVKSRKCKQTAFTCDVIVHNNKYEGFCLRCYVHAFPDRPVSRNYKTKENEVVNFLKRRFPNSDIVHDKLVLGGCSCRRPDCLMDLGDRVIVVECDENQHDSYNVSCENKRLMEISRDIDHRDLIMIRFNPDDYYDSNGKRVTSCFGINAKGLLHVRLSKRKEWQRRLDLLEKTVTCWMTQPSDRTVRVVHLFYDENIAA